MRQCCKCYLLLTVTPWSRGHVHHHLQMRHREVKQFAWGCPRFVYLTKPDFKLRLQNLHDAGDFPVNHFSLSHRHIFSWLHITLLNWFSLKNRSKDGSHTHHVHRLPCGRSTPLRTRDQAYPVGFASYQLVYHWTRCLDSLDLSFCFYKMEIMIYLTGWSED